MRLGTNCKTTAPLFGQRTAPVLLSPNLQLPLFMDTQEQPLEISIKWGIFCIAYIIFYQIIVLKGFKNKFECIRLLYDVDIGRRDSASSLFIQHNKRTSCVASATALQRLDHSQYPFPDRVPPPLHPPGGEGVLLNQKFSIDCETD